MIAKGSTFGNDFLKLIFNATPISNIAGDATTSPLTSLYVSLHTASPLVGGSQTTHEAAYTGYARVAVDRSASGWTVTGSSVSPTNDIEFPIATGGHEVETYFAIGTDATGTGKILYFGAINPAISVQSGVTPELDSSSTITEA